MVQRPPCRLASDLFITPIPILRDLNLEIKLLLEFSNMAIICLCVKHMGMFKIPIVS